MAKAKLLAIVENDSSQVTPSLTSSLQCLRDSYLVCSTIFQRHQEDSLLGWRHCVQVQVEIRNLG